MLKEFPAKQTNSDHLRRWLADEYFDLIVWNEPTGEFFGFQLCYDKTGHERALTWTTKNGFTHRVVDGGEAEPDANCTPILTHAKGNTFPAEPVRRQFAIRAYGVDPVVQDLVLRKIEEYAGLSRGGK